MWTYLNHRPLLVLALGLSVALTLPIAPWHSVFLIGLAACLRVRRSLVILGLATALGWWIGPRPVEPVGSDRWYVGPAVVKSYARTTNDLTSVALETEMGLVRGRSRTPITVIPNQKLWVQGLLTAPSSSRAYAESLAGFRGNLKLVELRPVADARPDWDWVTRVRNSYLRWNHRILPASPASWLNALALRGTELSEEDQENLRRTGTVHLIAASGLHAGVLLVVVQALALLVGVPRWTLIVLSVFALAVFAMANMLGMPTVRATAMACMLLVAPLVRRRYDSMSALSAIAVLYLLFEPRSIYSLGFQLSVGIVAGLALALPSRVPDLPLRHQALLWLRHSISVSVVAAVIAEPILGCHLGTWSLTTIPANVLGIPVAVGALSLGLVGWWIGAIFPPLGAGLTLSAGTLAEGLRVLVAWIGEFPVSELPAPTGSGYVVSAFLFGLAWISPKAQGLLASKEAKP